MLDHPLVVIDKKPAQICERRASFPFQKFKGSGEGVPGATPELTLVFHWRAS
jgi:hypothetical protein